jgi:hypothetical protein
MVWASDAAVEHLGKQVPRPGLGADTLARAAERERGGKRKREALPSTAKPQQVRNYLESE